MMLYTSWNSGDCAGGLYFQKALINFTYTVPAIPSLPTVFGVEPQTNQLLHYAKKYTVHGIYTDSIDNVKPWQL